MGVYYIHLTWTKLHSVLSNCPRVVAVLVSEKSVFGFVHESVYLSLFLLEINVHFVLHHILLQKENFFCDV